MDTKTESTPLSIRDLLPFLPDLHKLDWLPKGKDRFSPKELVENIKLALKNPKFTMPLFSVVALTCATINPLGMDPYPYLRDRILGPKAQMVEIGPQTGYEQLIEEFPREPIQESVNIEDQLFIDFSPEERTAIEKEIEQQVKIYKESNGSLIAERVLDWEKTTIKPILDRDVKPQDSQFWSELLSAIVYVESEGKPLAKSEAGIVGLVQISEATAAGTARKHGLLQFDLRKGWDSLRLGRFYLQDLMERFGPDITLLGYYAGGPFTDQRVLDALVKKGVPKDDSIIQKGITSNQQLHSYINHYGVNIANLGSADGEEYFIKVVAAHRILEAARVAG